MVEQEELVPIGLVDGQVVISKSLPANRRYVLPRVNGFLSTLSEPFYAVFSVPLTVDSAVRPVTVQRRIKRIYASAAPVTGVAASSHEAGCTVDLARRSLSRAQQRWLEYRLAYFQLIGKIIVEEERTCFHIMVVEDE